MSGACVSRATLQAADGAPMPTKQTSSFDSARAAAMVIISSAVNSAMEKLLHPFREYLGPHLHDILVHPGEEAVAVGGNPVPLEITPIVAAVVPVRIARMGAARHLGDRGHRPVRQDAGIGMHPGEIVDDLLDRHHGALCREHGFL